VKFAPKSIRDGPSISRFPRCLKALFDDIDAPACALGFRDQSKAVPFVKPSCGIQPGDCRLLTPC